MKLYPFQIAILFLAAVTGSGEQAQKFDASALFQPGMSMMQAAREACHKVPGSQFGECFVRQMQAGGASPQAVAFMHAIHNDGFMRDFVEAGNVDIAFVYYPFAANENPHCVLVNGTPNLIDVDGYNVVPRKELPENAEYAALREKFPNIAVFPGDRNGRNFITASKTADGGQSFLVPYVLVNGCHACARVGSLELAFEFDQAGKFLGAKVAKVGSKAPE
jgi:hypothetical protein